MEGGGLGQIRKAKNGEVLELRGATCNDCHCDICRHVSEVMDLWHQQCTCAAVHSTRGCCSWICRERRRECTEAACSMSSVPLTSPEGLGSKS